MSCLDDTLLAQLADGTLDGVGAAAIDGHVDGCVDCALLVAELVRALETGEAGVAERPYLAVGARIGRYVIVEMIGAGAMGQVYAASDPELGRRVALKLTTRQGPVDRERQLREARALARIRHPNVVAVHDVGTTDERDPRAFLAMELVPGTTLADATAGRPWREIVGWYAQAARGLSAAHEAGVVHRDFKPANVLLGEDGRVLVGDFGLARGDDAASTATAPRSTRTAQVGTPAYMAPEVAAGRRADERSDQYSFFVALRESLDGARAPRRLERAIARGLAALPAARHPSMSAVANQLDQVRPRRAWLAAALASAAIASALVIGARTRAAAPAPTCDGGAADVAAIWNDGTRRILRDRFAAGGRARWAAVERSLDDHAAALIATRRAACEATRVRGEQSDQVLTLRMACLRRRRAELGALIDALASAGTADAATRDQALLAAQRLPGMEVCDEDRVVAARRELDPATAAQVEHGIDEVAAAHALLQVGRRDQATRRLDAALALGDPEVQADAFRLRAVILETDGDRGPAEDAAHESLLAAERLGDAHRIADAAIELAAIAADAGGRNDDALRWIRHAEAALDHAGPDLRTEIQILTARGNLARRDARFDDAARELTLAMVLIAEDEARHGVGTAFGDRAIVARELSTVALSRGEPARAVAILEPTIAAVERAGGPDDARVVFLLEQLADAYTLLDQPDRAIELHRRVLALREGVFGAHSPVVATSMINLAVPLMNSGRNAEAETLLVGAIAIFEAKHDTPSIAQALVDLASAVEAQGRPAEAEVAARRALALAEATFGADHPYTAAALVALGQSLCAQRRCRDAVPLLDRALAIDERRFGPQSENLLFALDQLADAYTATGQPARAVPLLERSLALADTDDTRRRLADARRSAR